MTKTTSLEVEEELALVITKPRGKILHPSFLNWHCLIRESGYYMYAQYHVSSRYDNVIMLRDVMGVIVGCAYMHEFGRHSV